MFMYVVSVSMAMSMVVRMANWVLLRRRGWLI